MDAYEVWTDRLTASFRALGLALMVLVLGWILLTLAANIADHIGKGIAAALLIGYIGGRLHALWQVRRWRALKTIQSDDIQSVSRIPPLVARSWVPPRSEASAARDTENSSVKAFVEREMAASKDEELRKAADLTARQLQQAIEITEGKVGKERADTDGALVGAVLDVLATNYRLATR